MYELRLVKIIKKQQKILSKQDREKIKKIIWSLGKNPRPFKCKKLVGSKNYYRIRFRDYRILYSIDDKEKIVTIYGILSRKEAYK